MSQARVKSKVIEWRRIDEPRYDAYLECGHTAEDAGDGFCEDTKLSIEKDGNVMECYECSRARQRIAELEGELRSLKVTAMQRHGEGEDK